MIIADHPGKGTDLGGGIQTHRILLVSAGQEGFWESVFPLGAAYVAASLQREGVEARVFDASPSVFSRRSLRSAVLEFLPDIVGLSMRNIDNGAYPHSRCFIPEYSRIAGEIRAASKARLFLGGSAFSLFPQDLMRLLSADGGATGDGEDGILRLVQGEEGTVQHGKLDSLDSVGIPRDAEFLIRGYDRYRAIGVQTMRGCPQSSIHGTESVLEGVAIRPRPPEAVVDEIEFHFREHGKRDFFIVDSAFNTDEGHMASVSRAILSRNLQIRFACSLRPKVSDPSLFGLLAGAGCVLAEFRTDSGSDRILSSLRKGFAADDIRAASTACRKARIAFRHSLVFGGPGENVDTILETVRLMDEIAPRTVVATPGLRIYPRTKLHQIAIREGVLSPEDSLLGPRHYFPNNDPYWVLKEVEEAVSRRRNWILTGRRDWKRALGARLLRPFHTRGAAWETCLDP